MCHRNQMSFAAVGRLEGFESGAYRQAHTLSYIGLLLLRWGYRQQQPQQQQQQHRLANFLRSLNSCVGHWSLRIVNGHWDGVVQNKLMQLCSKSLFHSISLSMEQYSNLNGEYYYFVTNSTNLRNSSINLARLVVFDK